MFAKNMYISKKCDSFLLVEFHICFAFEYCCKISFDWVTQIVSSIISQMSIFMLRSSRRVFFSQMQNCLQKLLIIEANTTGPHLNLLWWIHRNFKK